MFENAHIHFYIFMPLKRSVSQKSEIARRGMGAPWVVDVNGPE
jgi:hypothetical protein